VAGIPATIHNWHQTHVRGNCLALAVSTIAQGQVESSLQDGTKQSGKEAHDFREIMDMLDKSIPHEFWIALLHREERRATGSQPNPEI
jgi:hypothetical protein